jgi:hypothetical protein
MAGKTLPYIVEADFVHFRQHFTCPLEKTYSDWLADITNADQLAEAAGKTRKREIITFASALNYCLDQGMPRNYHSILKVLRKAMEPT